MKRWIKERTKTEWILTGVLLVEFIFLIYYNLFHIRDAVDQDYAKILRHVIEMARHHTLFLPNWEYLTTGEMDAASLPAILFYLITKNIYLSYGLADILNIGIWSFTVHRVLRLCNVKLKYRLLCLCLIFTAYDFGMLAYTNMLFFAGGQYVYKALVPLLLVLILFDRNGKSIWFYRILYVVLLFFTDVASNTYVLLCGIIPIAICFVFYTILRQKQELHKSWVWIGIVTVIVSAAGIFLNHHYGIQTKSYSLKPINWLFSDHLFTLLELLKVFNPLTVEETGAFTVAGIMGLVRLLVAMIVLGFGFCSIPELFGFSVYQKTVKEDTVENRELINSTFISIFAWNYFVQFLTLASSRYHLIGVMPLFLCMIMNVEDFFDRDHKTQVSEWFLCGMSVLILLVNEYSLVHAERHYFKEEDGYYLLNESLIALMKEQKIGTAFVLDDGRIPERLRVLDTDLVFENYDPESGAVMNYDFYITERDRSAFTDRNIIIGPESKYEICPEYIRSSYTYLADYGEFGIWVSDLNPIDGMTGMYVGSEAVDLVTAPYYTVHGTIEPDGSMVSEETGILLESPVLSFGNRNVTMTVTYETKSETVTLELYDGEVLLDQIPLPVTGEYSLSIPAEYKTMQFLIRKEDKEPIQIRQVTYSLADMTAE